MTNSRSLISRSPVDGINKASEQAFGLSLVTSVDEASGITGIPEIQSRLRQCFYYSHSILQRLQALDPVMTDTLMAAF